jgi:hypothetical protein
MRWADSNENVLNWGSEIVVIQYLYAVDKKVHRYFVDFAIKIRKSDGTTENLLIEIKPKCQTIPPKRKRNEKTFILESLEWQKNQDKWNAATDWAKKNNFRFIVMTEDELGIK